LNRLGLNPQIVEKRLGDAAYEQNLVRDQLFALTGRRLLNNSTSEMAQYQSLMDGAYAANEAFHFTLGVALTAAQVAQLTTDIVWLVEQTVTLPNGVAQKVLVPQVYLSRVTRDDLTPEGALIAANNIQLVTPEFTNSGRMIAGRGIDLAALNITNSGTIQSTQTDSVTTLTAVNDLTNAGGTIAGGTLNLTAGNNLINRADSFERTTALNGGQLTETVVGAAGRLVANGDATLVAGKNLSFQGGELQAGGNAKLSAQGDLDLGAATKTARIAVIGNRGYSFDSTLTENTGSSVTAKGSVTLEAGNNLNVIASTVSSGTSLSATAGGAITVGTATDQNQYRVDSNKGVDHYQSDTQTAKGSTLSAGTDLSLNAGSTLTLEAATARAKQDITLASVGDLSILAGSSSRSTQGQHKEGGNSDSTTLYEQTVQGSIVDAGRNLSVRAGNAQAPANAPSTLTVQGSALAAGNDLKLASTGDLQLLAATSQRYENIQRTEQSKKKLETLNFELEQNRVLLSTLTAGNSIDLNVGGNLAAQTGTTDSEGKLQADRMTVDGVIKGTDRQQVSLTHTDDKAGTTLNGNTSKVLGDLKAQGIRSGATDNLSPEAIQTGQAAVTALINSGLLTLKNQPAVQAALNAPTPNGAALTYTDTTGKVTLSVAGEAKVQAVYSQLKLTETFDVKHFADQQTAQIVTLIAAIVLTICTGGAGAATLGGFLAGGAGMSAAVINAAIIGMVSTMTGQLAGGASFDQAFQAGLKSGAISAFTAGVAYGVSDALGLSAQVDSNGVTQGVNGGPANLNINPETGQAFNPIKYVTENGQKYAALSAMDKLGTSEFWTMAAANTTASGIASAAGGGKFSDGLLGGAAGVVGSTLNTAVGDWAFKNDIAPGDLSKVILHASIGAAQAKLTKHDALAGAIGGATAEVLSPLANDLDKATGNKAAGEITIALGGLAANAVLNKNNPLDMTAAYQALQTDRFNRQLHPKQVSQVKQKAKELDGTDGKSAVQWEKELTQQLLKQNDEANQGFSENAQARAILKELDTKSGVSMSAEGTDEYRNQAINAEYITQLKDSYNLVGLPSGMRSTLPVVKALSDAMQIQDFTSQSKTTQRAIYDQLVTAYGSLPTDAQALSMWNKGQIDKVTYDAISGARAQIENTLYINGPTIRSSGILTQQELDASKNQNRIAAAQSLSMLAVGVVAGKSLGASGMGAKGVGVAVDEAVVNVPKGYLANVDGTITGPRGGTYSPTRAFDGSGNPIFIDGTGNYYTMTSSGATRVVSPNPPSSIGVTGQIGEDALKSLGGQPQVTLQTSQGARVVDQLAPGGIANEAKVGYTTLDASTALQVSKDAELLQTKAVNGVAWNFYTSPVTGQGGPSAALLKALTDAGIKVIIH
jgi:hypothetical protein